MRVVLDTNVLVSALLKTGSAPDIAVSKILATKSLLLSPDVLAEYEEVLNRSKFLHVFSPTRVKELLGSLLVESIFIVPFTEITDCVDATDNKLLSLAVDGGADCIVTGDDHLLRMNPYRTIPILGPTDFLNIF